MTAPLQTPLRVPLAAQTYDLIDAAIRRGDWGETLPSEAFLAEKLQIGRSTLRLALERLRGEGIIETGRGRRSRIVRKKSRRRKPELQRTVALASGIPLSLFPPSSLRMIERIQRYLYQTGHQVELHFNAHFSASDPRRGFKEILARKSDVGCWLFFSPNQKIQAFLERHSIGAVVAGSSFEGVTLPAIDESHRATARHAVNLLHGRGHRNVALLVSENRTAGELASETGFLEGAQTAAQTSALVIRCTPSREGVLRAMRRLLRLRVRPTALLVFHAHYVQTVTGFLFQSGLKIPGDMSVVALNSEDYLHYAVPDLTRYAVDPFLYARRLYRLILRVSKGEKVEPGQAYVWPRLIEGNSVSGPVQVKPQPFTA